MVEREQLAVRYHKEKKRKATKRSERSYRGKRKQMLKRVYREMARREDDEKCATSIRGLLEQNIQARFYNEISTRTKTIITNA